MDRGIQSTDIRKLKKEMINTLYFTHPVTNQSLVAEMRIALELELSFEIDLLNDNNDIISDYITHKLSQRVDIPFHMIFGTMKSISKRSHPTHELSLIEVSFEAEESIETTTEEDGGLNSIQKFSEYIMNYFTQE